MIRNLLGSIEIKVLTAGHCIIKQLEIQVGNNVILANPTTNQNYPTIESMYTVYLGLQSTNGIYSSSYIPGGEKMAVSQLIPVRI